MTFFKRLLPVFLVMIILLFAFGCGYSNNQADILSQENEQKTVTEEGVLKALGVNLGQKGTHLLQKNNNEIVLLFSNYVDLDSEEYLGKKVSVTGPLIKGKEGEKDVISVELVKTLGAGSDTAMKVYEDVDLGFRVEYPGVLTPAKSQSRVVFRSSEDSEQMLVISKIALPSGMNLEKYLSDILGVSEQSTAAIGGLSGYQVASPDDTLIDMYVEGENAVFNLSHLSENSLSQETYRAYFLAMVKSFSLIGEEKASEGDIAETVSDIEALGDIMDMPEEEEVKSAEAETAETVKETPTVTSKPTPEPQVTVPAPEPADTSLENETTEDSAPDSADNDTQKSVMQYIQANISTIAPDPSENGSWKTTKFEFVEPNYVYVEYDDGVARRKLLLTYAQSDDRYTTAIVGYFKTDKDENWETVSGSNAAYGKERTVYAGADAEASFTLLPGYRYFESSTYGFKIQYPSAWYFAGSSGVYSFSDQPLEDGNALVTLEVRNQGISGVSGADSNVNGVTIISTEENGVSVVYAERKDSRSYRLSGDSVYADIMKTMAGTITD